MPFNMEQLEKEVRYYWDEALLTEAQCDKLEADRAKGIKPAPDKEREWVEFQLIYEEVTNRLRKQAGIKQKKEYHNHVRHEYWDRGDEKVWEFGNLQICAQIVNWQLFDPEGKNIPCTDGNKIKLARGSVKFGTWMAKCLKEMERLQGVTAQEDQDNLEPI